MLDSTQPIQLTSDKFGKYEKEKPGRYEIMTKL